MVQPKDVPKVRGSLTQTHSSPVPHSNPPELPKPPTAGQTRQTLTNNSTTVLVSTVTNATPNQVRRSPRKASNGVYAGQPNLTEPNIEIRSEFQSCQFKDREKAVHLYSYLNYKTVKPLHFIAKQWKVRISTRTKEEIIARCMIYIFVRTQTGTTFDELVRKNRSCNDYKSWVQNSVQDCRTWDILPEIQALIDKLHPTDRSPAIKAVRVAMKAGTNESDAAGGGKTNFSLNEFARLLVLLRDDNRCRHALLKACGKELSKDEMSIRITREAFWGVIAQRFNNNLVDSKEDFTGHLEEVNSNARALCERTASVLKEHFYEARRDFTDVYDKWSASGQNDPDRIVSFLRLSGTGDYTMGSKRTLVMFLVCRVGTPQEETNLLQLTSKLIGNGEGGLDEGINGSAAHISGETRSQKRRSSNEIQGSLDEMSKSLSNFTGYVKQQLEYQKEQSETGGKRRRSYAEDEDEEERLAGKLLASAEMYKRATETGDTEVQNMIKGILVRHKKRLKEFRDERAACYPDKKM